MLRKTIVVCIAYVSLLTFMTISCDLTGPECGPFSSRFKTIDFDTNIMSIAFIDSSGTNIELTPLEKDSAAFDEIAIHLIPVKEYYFAKANYKNSFSFSSVAYACSPAVPISTETIQDIQIYSNTDYNTEFTSGENLAGLFDVVVQYQRMGYQRFDLAEFLNDSHTVPEQIILLLKSAPSSTREFQFTLKYFQEGIDFDEFEFTTGSIAIQTSGSW